MYVPAHLEENRIELLQRLIRERLLGALVTLTAQGLNADHIPFEIDPEPEPLGTLRAHVARKQLAAIVGIEIALSKLIGKWKVSQNRSAMDRRGVVNALAERQDGDAAATAYHAILAGKR